MHSNKDNERIPDNIITDDYFNVLHRAYEQMQEVFERLQREDGITQDRIAKRLGVHKSLVSRRLHGGENLTLRALSGLATAMDCKLGLTFTPYKDLPTENAQPVAAETIRPATRFEVVLNEAMSDDVAQSTSGRTSSIANPETRRGNKPFQLVMVNGAIGGHGKKRAA